MIIVVLMVIFRPSRRIRLLSQILQLEKPIKILRHEFGDARNPDIPGPDPVKRIGRML